MPLEDHLSIETVSTTPLAPPEQLDVEKVTEPLTVTHVTAAAGLAVVCVRNNGLLQAIDKDSHVIATQSLTTGDVQCIAAAAAAAANNNLAALVVAYTNGALECYNLIGQQFQLQWTTTSLSNVTNLAACDQNVAVIADNVLYSIECRSNDAALEQTKVCTGALCLSYQYRRLAVGLETGTIQVYEQLQKRLEIPAESSQSRCTHVDWVKPNRLLAGYQNQEDEVSLQILELDSSLSVIERTDLGDVIPFFSIDDRHVFWTQTIGPLVLVMANVGNDLAIVDWKEKRLVELENPWMTPTVDDEFVYPTGMAALSNTSIFVTTTDGSLLQLQMQHKDDPNFFAEVTQEPAAIIMEEQVLADEQGPAHLVEEGTVPALGATPFGGGGMATFGNSKPVFGQTSSLFGSSPSQPVFGQTSSLVGSPSTSSPDKSSTAPVFGSGSSVPVFGSGSSPSLGSFAALAASSPNPMAKPLFSESAATLNPMIQPLFGDSPNKAVSTAGTQEATATDTQKAAPAIVVEPSEPSREYTSEASIKVAKVFDSFDSAKDGSLPMDKVEELLEELGEGFHGDELDKQLKSMDPKSTGLLHRSAFVEWYERLVAQEEDKDDEDYVEEPDLEEEAEREEERQTARKAFSRLSDGNDWIAVRDFPKLIESMNTTYCEEEHVKTIKKLQKDDKIYLDDFIDWYIGWLFGGDEDSDDEEEEDQVVSDDAVTGPSIWNAMATEGSWKCASCIVSNRSAATKCAACEQPRPGYDVSKSRGDGSQASGGGGITLSGFTFGGSDGGELKNDASQATGGFSFGSGTGGFSFGTPPPQQEASTSTGGFTFAPPISTEIKDAAQVKFEKKAEEVDLSSAEARKAARVFDSIDSQKSRTLPASKLVDLLDELGEGLYGDECSAQLKLIDPDGSGELGRTAFINWYISYVETQEDNSESLDSDDKAEREEEREKARKCFLALSDDTDSISVEAFPKLIESLDTTYCEEEHRRTLKRLTKDEHIFISDFLDWYVDWLFGGDEDSIEEGDVEGSDAQPADQVSSDAAGETGWGNRFTQSEGGWKCGVCMVENLADSKKCAACETPRPGAEVEQKESSTPALVSGSSVGTGGFTFGPDRGTGFGGFSFGAPAAQPTTGGFTFGPASVGFNVSDTAPPASEPSSATGFTFAPTTGFSSTVGTGTNVKGSVGGAAPEAAETSEIKEEGVSSTQDTAQHKTQYPPMPNKAPKPFGETKSTTEKKSSGASSSYPPIPTKAPTPFGALSVASTASKEKESSASVAAMKLTKEAASASSGYPPMPKEAPVPFGSKADAKSQSTASAYPPVSAKTPKPFGSQSTSAASSTPKGWSDAESETPPETTRSSKTSYPPMSGIAPTPFGTQKVSQKPASTGYPPMAGAAPTPFGSAKPTAKTVSNASATSYPPMSGTAPTPFGTPKVSQKPASTGYPPMAEAAPTPFGSAKPTVKKVSSAASSSYPPMAHVGPSPFSTKSEKATPSTASKTKADSAVTAFGLQSQQTTMSTGGLPASSTSHGAKPSPLFGSGGPGAATKKPATSSTQSARNQAVLDEEISVWSKQFLKLVEKLNETLSGLKRDRSSKKDGTRDAIERLVTEKGLMFVAVEKVSNLLLQYKGEVTVVVCKHSEAERHVEQSQRITARLASQSDEAFEDFYSQPLDSHSEKCRRELEAKAIQAKTCLDIAEACTRILTNVEDFAPNVLTSVLKLYERVNNLNENAHRIERNVSKSFPEDDLLAPSLSRSPLLRKLPPSNRASEGSSRFLNARARHKTEHKGFERWTTVEEAFLTMEAPSAKSFDLGWKSTQESEDKAVVGRWFDSQYSSPRPKSSIFSPPWSRRVRPGWDDSIVDQERLKTLSFSSPQDLRYTTLNEGAREALSNFGTTPERVQRGLDGSISAVVADARTASNLSQTGIPNDLDYSALPTKERPGSPVVVPDGVPAPGVAFGAKPKRGSASNITGKSMAPPDLSLRREVAEESSQSSSKKQSFGDMSSLGTSLFQNEDVKKMSTSTGPTDGSSGTPDYRALMSTFYEKHNPAKVADAVKNLEKYKGREKELFAKLAQKYNVPNPLEPGAPSGAPAPSVLGNSSNAPTQSSGFGASTSTQGTGFGSASLFSSPAAQVNISPSGPAPGFGLTSSPFAPQPAAPQPSPFGGQSLPPAPAPFGSPAAQSAPSPFGAPISTNPSTKTFNGRTPRELLTAFYQERNPAKLGEIDKVLAKYQGKEDQMFLNLAKKYSLDPSVFGVSASAGLTFGSPGGGIASSLGGFGQPSQLGGGQAFGSAPAPVFGSGGGGGFGFGSAGGSNFAGPSFGDLAHQAAPAQSSGFGGFGAAPAPFSTPTPFGAPRR